MKTITLRNGDTENLYKPHEAAKILKYHPRTIRRFIQDGRIKAIDSNAGGKQPIWWISQKEIDRLGAFITVPPAKTKATKGKPKRKK